jgi:hypothetical protein
MCGFFVFRGFGDQKMLMGACSPAFKEWLQNVGNSDRVELIVDIEIEKTPWRYQFDIANTSG